MVAFGLRLAASRREASSGIARWAIWLKTSLGRATSVGLGFDPSWGMVLDANVARSWAVTGMGKLGLRTVREDRGGKSSCE